MRVFMVLGFLLASFATMAVAQSADRSAMLLEAASAGDAGSVRDLLAGGVAVDARDADRRTPLLLATRANHPHVARLLIEAGADVNARDNIRDTPFLYAGAEGRDEILSMILATGRANLRDTNRYGGNALIPAAHHGHPQTVRILLDAGIDIDHVNDLGWTALLETVILGDGGPVYQEIARLLVESGADLAIADRDGVTALEHARARGYEEIAAMLETSGR